MPYVDGFVLVVPEDRLKDYAKLARLAGKVWREHGALDYKECVLDESHAECGLPFPKLAKCKPGEVVVFAWIVYTSKAHRNKVNARVMKDPRIMQCDDTNPPFDMKRMTYGGFKVLVDA